MNPTTDFNWAYALARLGLGINISLHGLTRLPDLRGFASGLQKQFSGSILPQELVGLSAYGIAIGEAAVGILLVLGLFLRPALVAGSLIMILLLFGTCLVQNWNGAGIQMIYLAFYSGMLAAARWDHLSIDNLRKKHTRSIALQPGATALQSDS